MGKKGRLLKSVIALDNRYESVQKKVDFQDHSLSASTGFKAYLSKNDLIFLNSYSLINF